MSAIEGYIKTRMVKTRPADRRRQTGQLSRARGGGGGGQEVGIEISEGSGIGRLLTVIASRRAQTQ